MNNIILIGFKGSGKTTYGKKLAQELHRPFIDTDDLFPEPPATLYQKLGSAAFRTLEKELLLSLKDLTNHVIATGGGVVLDPENRSLLRELGTIIYLDTPREIIEERIGSSHFLLKEYEERREIYRSIADVISTGQ